MLLPSFLRALTDGQTHLPFSRLMLLADFSIIANNHSHDYFYSYENHPGTPTALEYLSCLESCSEKDSPLSRGLLLILMFIMIKSP